METHVDQINALIADPTRSNLMQAATLAMQAANGFTAIELRDHAKELAHRIETAEADIAQIDELHQKYTGQPVSERNPIKRGAQKELDRTRDELAGVDAASKALFFDPPISHTSE